MKFHNSVLSLIGNTPLVRIKNIDTGLCELFIKLENQNPTGSLKDRIALYMIEEAEKAGSIHPGDMLVESTSGNTGVSVAFIASLKGYKLTIVVHDKASEEKVSQMKALGAEVVITSAKLTKEDVDYYRNIAERIANENKAFYLSQFTNPKNPEAYEKTLAPEIWEAMEHDIDAVICTAGSGGHLTGIGYFLRHTAFDTEVILADPEGSSLAEYVRTGQYGQKGEWLVEGIGDVEAAEVCDLSLVNSAITITDAESFASTRELFAKEGVFAGSSTGTALAAALKYCRTQTKAKRVVTFAYDTGYKTLSKVYNDKWMFAHGFKV